jgi:hypothetical protein
MFIGSPLESVKQSLLSRNQPFIAAPSEPTPPGAPKLSGVDLYSRFAFAGAVCCSDHLKYLLTAGQNPNSIGTRKI